MVKIIKVRGQLEQIQESKQQKLKDSNKETRKDTKGRSNLKAPKTTTEYGKARKTATNFGGTPSFLPPQLTTT